MVQIIAVGLFQWNPLPNLQCEEPMWWSLCIGKIAWSISLVEAKHKGTLDFWSNGQGMKLIGHYQYLTFIISFGQKIIEKILDGIRRQFIPLSLIFIVINFVHALKGSNILFVFHDFVMHFLQACNNKMEAIELNQSLRWRF